MANKPKKNSYESGHAEILQDDRHHLSAAVDCSGSDMQKLKERTIVLNFSPNINVHEHYHITLEYESALKLKKFLDGYIEEVYPFHEGKNA